MPVRRVQSARATSAAGALGRLNRRFTAHCRRALLAGAGALLLAGGALATGVEGRGDGAFAHVRALQEIASANGGNRAAGSAGYDRSADYVAERLRAAGYTARFEEFTFPFFEERTPPIVATGSGESAFTPLQAASIRTLAHSGSGEVTARLQAVDLDLRDGAPSGPSTSGCEVADFDRFERGSVALLRRGSCPFQVKVENATAAGAAGVIIMNEGGGGERMNAFSGRLMRLAAVPVVGIAFEPGQLLASALGRDGNIVVRLQVNAETGLRSTRNVLADRAGDPARTIVIGAHLDSVPDGPGINDNASGSAAVLEAALRLAGPASGLVPRLRFAFWGAEEAGLIGSRHHVNSLSEAERRAILLYVNLDMVASPNFGRFIQAAQETPEGIAGAARGALAAYFRDRNLAVEERVRAAQRGFGSDDASFAEKGIPTLGLYAGAGEAKQEAHAAVFGGSAGRPFDPCYHRACDTADNVDRGVLEQMSAALAHALGELAR
jgi:Zn-dependent M28 family amino/carboxypeptidase